MQSHKFNNLTVENIADLQKKALEKVSFKCDCGVVKMIRLSHVIHGITKSCGCIKRKHKTIVGDKFNRLTVKSDEIVKVGGHLKVLCECECGSKKLIGIAELVTGVTKSCGCLIVEQIRAMSLKHGKWQSPLFSVWSTIKSRCNNINAANYTNYGGRGIKICDEWLKDFDKFECWSMLNGYEQGLEIDRIDVNGNYDPNNCRYVTSKVNGNNRRNNKLLTAFNETKTMSNWASDYRCVVTYSTLRQRIRKNLPHELAITKPLNTRK